MRINKKKEILEKNENDLLEMKIWHDGTKIDRKSFFELQT